MNRTVAEPDPEPDPGQSLQPRGLSKECWGGGEPKPPRRAKDPDESSNDHLDPKHFSNRPLECWGLGFPVCHRDNQSHPAHPTLGIVVCTGCGRRTWGPICKGEEPRARQPWPAISNGHFGGQNCGAALVMKSKVEARDTKGTGPQRACPESWSPGTKAHPGKVALLGTG